MNNVKKSIMGVVMFAASLWGLNSLASSSCSGHFVNPVTDICWSCIFPFTIGVIPVHTGSHPDTENPSMPVCHCGINPLTGWGLAVGYWSPDILIDVTRHPYCMVNLGGWKMPRVRKVGTGAVSNYTSNNNHSFYYVHYIAYPVVSWLINMACQESDGFGVGYLSELDPTWNDEKLNHILYPENGVVARLIQSNPVALEASNTADCVAATAHLPIDSLYWNVGCQGSLYPMEGEVQEHVDDIQATTLLSERALLKLHRMGFIQDSDKNSLCDEHYSFFLPKSRYRYQLVNPRSAKDCYPLGHATATWISGLIHPQSSEDYGYLMWKKRNCCAHY